jgi:hypothetical protein
MHLGVFWELTSIMDRQDFVKTQKAIKTAPKYRFIAFL